MNAIMAHRPSTALGHIVSLSHHSYLIRPVGASDEAGLVDMFLRSSAKDVCLRCLGAVRDFPRLGAARLMRADSNRELAIVAVHLDIGPQREIVGVVHLINEPGKSESAEFDVMVRTDMQGRGIGFELMKEMLTHARERGLKTIVGYVAGENRKMLWMASELGFSSDFVAPGIIKITAQV
jgi:acetyltransferase